jgi:hypothetical protein
MHLYDHFKGMKKRHQGLHIEPVQYDFEIDFAGRFGQWPPKKTTPE